MPAGADGDSGATGGDVLAAEAGGAEDSEWTTFLRNVDAVPQSEEVMSRVKAALLAVQLRDPASALGADADDVVKKLEEDDVAGKALLRRTFRCLEQTARVQEARQIVASQTVPAGVLPNEASGSQQLQQSALALANAFNLQQQVRTPEETVDVQELLQEASLASTPADGITDNSAFVDLVKKTKQAKKEGKVPFSFVDITQKEFLPLWLTPESIGGRTAVAGDDVVLDGGHDTTTMAKLTEALKSATSAPRFFRNLNQWVACFVKYAVLALSCGQLTLGAVLGHMSTVTRIIEDKRATTGNSTYLALLYDEHRRKDWSKRADRKDPSLKIEEEAWCVDDELLRSVQTRLSSTLRAAGISGQDASDVNASSSLLLAARESAFAKTQSAQAQMQKKLDNQQRDLEKLSRNDGGRGPGANNGKGGSYRGSRGGRGNGKGGHNNNNGRGGQRNGGKGDNKRNWDDGYGGNQNRRVIQRQSR